MVPTQALSPTQAIDCNPDPSADHTIDPCRIRNSGRLLDLYGYLSALPSAHTLGYVFPGNLRLAARFGVSVRTVERWIARLEKIGAIAIEYIEGIERRISLLVTPAHLRELLLRGVAALARVARSVGGRVTPDVRGLPLEGSRGGNDNKPPGHGVVSSSEVAAAQAAVKAYAQRHPVRSMGALLTAAIKGRWQPPAPVSEHPSDRNERPVRVVTAPPGWQLGASRAGNAPTGAQAPRRGVPGLSPVSVPPALAAIVARCEARRGEQGARR